MLHFQTFFCKQLAFFWFPPPSMSRSDFERILDSTRCWVDELACWCIADELGQSCETLKDESRVRPGWRRRGVGELLFSSTWWWWPWWWWTWSWWTWWWWWKRGWWQWTPGREVFGDATKSINGFNLPSGRHLVGISIITWFHLLVGIRIILGSQPMATNRRKFQGRPQI